MKPTDHGTVRPGWPTFKMWQCRMSVRRDKRPAWEPTEAMGSRITFNLSPPARQRVFENLASMLAGSFHKQYFTFDGCRGGTHMCIPRVQLANLAIAACDCDCHPRR